MTDDIFAPLNEEVERLTQHRLSVNSKIALLERVKRRYTEEIRKAAQAAAHHAGTAREGQDSDNYALVSVGVANCVCGWRFYQKGLGEKEARKALDNHIEEMAQAWDKILEEFS